MALPKLFEVLSKLKLGLSNIDLGVNVYQQNKDNRQVSKVSIKAKNMNVIQIITPDKELYKSLDIPLLETDNPIELVEEYDVPVINKEIADKIHSNELFYEAQESEIEMLSKVLDDYEVNCIEQARIIIGLFENGEKAKAKQLKIDYRECYEEFGNKVYNLVFSGDIDNIFIPLIAKIDINDINLLALIHDYFLELVHKHPYKIWTKKSIDTRKLDVKILSKLRAQQRQRSEFKIDVGLCICVYCFGIENIKKVEVIVRNRAYGDSIYDYEKFEYEFGKEQGMGFLIYEKEKKNKIPKKEIFYPKDIEIQFIM